jgi:hypothetical protein
MNFLKVMDIIKAMDVFGRCLPPRTTMMDDLDDAFSRDRLHRHKKVDIFSLVTLKWIAAMLRVMNLGAQISMLL